MRHIFITLIVVCSISAVSCGQVWRPCGAGDSSRPHRFVPQGWKGADFRPACVQHDKYYNSPYPIITRKQADLIFLRDMLTECDLSSQPIRAKIIARNMYRACRLFGRRAYPKGT